MKELNSGQQKNIEFDLYEIELEFRFDIIKGKIYLNYYELNITITKDEAYVIVSSDLPFRQFVFEGVDDLHQVRLTTD